MRFLNRWARASFSFTGETTRIGYLATWPLMLVNWLLLFVIAVLALQLFGWSPRWENDNPSDYAWIIWAFYALAWTNALALMTRRLRDTGFSTSHAIWIMAGHFVCTVTHVGIGLHLDPVTQTVGTIGSLMFCIGWGALFLIPTRAADGLRIIAA